MITLAIIGRKGSGKTSLIEKLLEALPCRENVAVIKHIHHPEVEFDVKGTDTWRFKRAGARVVVGLAPGRFFLNADLGADLEMASKLIGLALADVKLLLLEGFSGQVKEDMNWIVAARSIEEVEELINNRHPPLAIYCRSCNADEFVGIPVCKTLDEVVELVLKLLEEKS